MATARDNMNEVLRGLRQYALIIDSGTSSTTDDYLRMILQFVNTAKEEIEESGHPWHALRATIVITLSSGTRTYAITSAGPADTNTTDRSRLLYEQSGVAGAPERFYNGHASLPQVWDVTETQELRLTEVSWERMERMHQTDDNETERPSFFSLHSDGSNLVFDVWPTPDATYTINTRFYNPEAEVANTSLGTTILVPTRPVWTLALWKASQERGEELGAPGSSLHRQYLDAHGVAVAKEQTPADMTVYLER